MQYMLNPSVMTSVFMMPSESVKGYIKLASAEQLRVLIYTMSNISTGIEPEKTAEFLKIHLQNVLDSLAFWADAGVFLKQAEEKPISFDKTEKKPRKITVEPSKLSREEIAMLGDTDPKIVFLLREAELKFARPLRFNEMQTLVGLYTDEGMDISLVLMIVEYAISEGKPTLAFINETARVWQSAGVESVVSAEEQIEKRNRQKSAWAIVEKSFGIEHRIPSTKELEFSEKWIIEWKFDRAMLKEAYEVCVDNKTKLNLPYINKILEGWFRNGYKTPAETKSVRVKEDKPKGMATYDKALLQKMLNNDEV